MIPVGELIANRAVHDGVVLEVGVFYRQIKPVFHGLNGPFVQACLRKRSEEFIGVSI